MDPSEGTHCRTRTRSLASSPRYPHSPGRRRMRAVPPQHQARCGRWSRQQSPERPGRSGTACTRNGSRPRMRSSRPPVPAPKLGRVRAWGRIASPQCPRSPGRRLRTAVPPRTRSRRGRSRRHPRNCPGRSGTACILTGNRPRTPRSK